jgi:hypothetical protein
MDQAADLIYPRLHVETASTVRYYDRPRVSSRHILDKLALKFGELERPVIGLAIILVVGPTHTTTALYLAKLERGSSEAQLS